MSSAVALFLAAGCAEENKPSTDDLIAVNVTAKYPEKELILQDFADVEYIPLETTDHFLTQGSVKAIGQDLIWIKNYISEGSIHHDIAFTQRLDAHNLVEAYGKGKLKGRLKEIAATLNKDSKRSSCWQNTRKDNSRRRYMRRGAFNPTKHDTIG